MPALSIPSERTIDRRLARLDLREISDRRVRPLSQRELAAKLGVSRNKVTSIENSALAKFAKAFAELGVHQLKDIA
jgi:predicted DNA-binding protein (UPF0251 family)